MDFSWLNEGAFIALAQVIVIDIVLAGDNAIVVGMAAAGVPKEMRGKVILWGVAAAVVMRIAFALVTTQILAVIGLTLAGGILLLWVCWKLYRELTTTRAAVDDAAHTIAGEAAHHHPKHKTMRAAIVQIAVADLSMSLDNVLAVAGAAHEHAWVLVVGLTLSVALMGAAASLIARLLQKHRWIAYIGLAIILYVAVDMIIRGWDEVAKVML